MSDPATNENLREGRRERGDFGKDKGAAMKKGWQTKKLSEVCEKITDGTHQTPTYFDDGVLFLSSRNVTSGTIDWENVKYIDAKQHGEMQRRVSPRLNDILLAKNGTTGVAAMVDRDVPFDIYVSLALLRPLAAVRPTFLLHFINSPLAKEQFTKRLKGIGVPNLHLEEIREVQIPVPPLAEQQRIVGLLDEAFEGLATAKANAETNLQNARALFESHLQSVFTQRGPEWVETTLDKISTNLDSKRVPITKNVRTSGEYPYYGASGIVDYVGDYIFEGANLLVSEDGANLLARSTPIAFSVSGKYWVNNHAHILKFENMATQRFVEFYLESIKLDDYITGAAQPKLNQKALNSIPIPIPKSVETQAKIVESLESLQEQTHHLARLYEQKLAALAALKKSLLHQAFTGAL